MSTTKILLKGWDMTVKKATLKSALSPKEKHVRKMIAGNTGKHPLPELMEALNKRMTSCRDSSSHLKCLYCIHRCLQESSSEFITQLKYRAHMLQLADAAAVSPILGSQGLEFTRQYARYLHAKVESFRALKAEVERNPDHCKGLPPAKLLKALPPLQLQLSELTKLARFTPMAHSGFSVVLSCFQLLLKDSFRLFNALNIGMICLLDHYFKMPVAQAQLSLRYYIEFVEQTRHINDFFAQCSAFARDLPKLQLPSSELIHSLEQYILDHGGDLPSLSQPLPPASPVKSAAKKQQPQPQRSASTSPTSSSSSHPTSTSQRAPTGSSPSSTRLPSHFVRKDSAPSSSSDAFTLSPMERQMVEHQRAQAAAAAAQQQQQGFSQQEAALSLQQQQIREVQRREQMRLEQQRAEQQQAEQRFLEQQRAEQQRAEQLYLEQQRAEQQRAEQLQQEQLRIQEMQRLEAEKIQQLHAEQLRIEQQMALAKQQQIQFQLKQQISQQQLALHQQLSSPSHSPPPVAVQAQPSFIPSPVVSAAPAVPQQQPSFIAQQPGFIPVLHQQQQQQPSFIAQPGFPVLQQQQQPSFAAQGFAAPGFAMPAPTSPHSSGMIPQGYSATPFAVPAAHSSGFLPAAAAPAVAAPVPADPFQQLFNDFKPMVPSSDNSPLGNSPFGSAPVQTQPNLFL